MFVISEVCCNFCDWWRMKNQKLHKQPCWISWIIDGINIHNLGRWPPNDYLGPNSVSFHPVVQKIYNNFLCLINLADSEDDWNVIKLWLNHMWQFVIGEVSYNVCDWWSVAMSVIGEVLCKVCEVCCNVRDRWSCYSACDWWSLLEYCNVFHWWTLLQCLRLVKDGKPKAMLSILHNWWGQHTKFGNGTIQGQGPL